MACHLTNAERDAIVQLRNRGADQKEIARALNRSPATISRERGRNSTGGDDHAAQAQQHVERRRRERPIVRKMENAEINQSVRHGLASYFSPEQIAGRGKLVDEQGPSWVSARTIYRWIHRDRDRLHWQSFLRRRGKRPHRRKKPDMGRAPVAEHPAVAAARLRLGDFERDTMLGPPGSGGLATLVDRKSRYTIVVKIRSKDADHVHQKIKDRLKQLDGQAVTVLTERLI